ncbi:OmpW family outer membrane protein [Colwellia sp. UCD-KL20]|uniref:OmpW/AlkL family protein n=1 Tax=Colwellia sp. UCD-KL20 TaxID=1917165 RepID=UPI00097123B7|nr:OmpW family outer membrane protein [Colwellia sp. UCD-KL20]
MKKNILTLTLCTILSTSTFAADYQSGDIVVRGGITNVNASSDHTSILLNNTDSSMTLTVDDNSQLGLNFLYFYSTNIAIEVLAATPFTHDVTIHDKNAVLNVDGAKLGEVTQLPPTISVLYYIENQSAFKPYVGLGVNYTIFFDEQFEDAPKSLGLSNLELDASFGLSYQLGVDYLINDNFHINASARYIDISTDATFDVGGESIGKATIDVDPMVYSIMLGYKF